MSKVIDVFSKTIKRLYTYEELLLETQGNNEPKYLENHNVDYLFFRREIWEIALEVSQEHFQNIWEAIASYEMTYFKWFESIPIERRVGKIITAIAYEFVAVKLLTGEIPWEDS